MEHIKTPVIQSWWRQALASHPDQTLVKYELDGVSGLALVTALLSERGVATCHAPTQQWWTSTCLKMDRIVKLSKEEAARARVHCSPIGIIPKKNRPGKWRLVVTF